MAGGIISHWHTLIDNFNTSGLDFYAAVEEAIRARNVPDVEFSRVTHKEGGVGSAEREYLRVEHGSIAFDIGAAPYGNGFFFSWWLVRPRPGYLWLWSILLFGASVAWVLVLLSLLAQQLNASLIGDGTGGTGCAILLLFIGFPAVVFLIGWSIHKGYIPLEEENVLLIPVVGWIYDKIFAPNTYYALDTALMFQESIRRAVNEVINGLLSDQGLRTLTEEQKKPTIRDLSRR